MAALVPRKVARMRALERRRGQRLCGDFSTYDHRSFGPADHRRLADVMRSLDCMVQLVIKATPTVREVYAHDDWCVRAFDTTYMWTVKDRNDREATHLVITNYDPDQA